MEVKKLIVHHTVSPRDTTTVENVNEWHKRFPISSLGYRVGYHYLILGNGKVVQTRKDDEMGMHTIPNYGRVGIALTGNFMKGKESPSNAQLNSLNRVLEEIKLKYNLQNKDILAHKEVSSTDCPGDNLMKWILLKRQMSVLQRMISLLKRFFGR